MNRPAFALIVAAVAAIALIAMWIGWRSRSRRDSRIATAATAPVGALIGEFSRVFYISTTPVGEPLSRVAVPGLRYRGRAEIAVREDGVTIDVDGERPVHLSSSQIEGSGTAGRRVGKAVEQGGLALLVWRAVESGAAGAAGAAAGRALESSFRFDTGEEQRRFTTAIDQISSVSSTHQEGAK